MVPSVQDCPTSLKQFSTLRTDQMLLLRNSDRCLRTLSHTGQVMKHARILPPSQATTFVIPKLQYPSQQMKNDKSKLRQRVRTASAVPRPRVRAIAAESATEAAGLRSRSDWGGVDFGAQRHSAYGRVRSVPAVETTRRPVSKVFFLFLFHEPFIANSRATFWVTILQGNSPCTFAEKDMV
jgi:hypothetical protein